MSMLPMLRFELKLKDYMDIAMPIGWNRFPRPSLYVWFILGGLIDVLDLVNRGKQGADEG
jgi:hypothetical protein